jgi:hypothetical protein
VGFGVVDFEISRIVGVLNRCGGGKKERKSIPSDGLATQQVASRTGTRRKNGKIGPKIGSKETGSLQHWAGL